MRSVASDLDNFARRHGLRRGVEATAVLKIARGAVRRVVPPTVAGVAEPVSFREGVVTITAPAGALLASLGAYRGVLLDELSAETRGLVRRVVVRARPAPREAPPTLR